MFVGVSGMCSVDIIVDMFVDAFVDTFVDTFVWRAELPLCNKVYEHVSCYALVKVFGYCPDVQARWQWHMTLSTCGENMFTCVPSRGFSTAAKTIWEKKQDFAHCIVLVSRADRPSCA